jgi:hypothetical protein
LVLPIRKWLGLELQNALPECELQTLVESHGFQVIETHSVCFMPRMLALMMPRSLWLLLERTLSAARFLRRYGIYQIHVAVRVPAGTGA